jgi:hypothetical protein
MSGFDCSLNLIALHIDENAVGIVDAGDKFHSTDIHTSRASRTLNVTLVGHVMDAIASIRTLHLWVPLVARRQGQLRIGYARSNARLKPNFGRLRASANHRSPHSVVKNGLGAAGLLLIRLPGGVWIGGVVAAAVGKRQSLAGKLELNLAVSAVPILAGRRVGQRVVVGTGFDGPRHVLLEVVGQESLAPGRICKIRRCPL